MHFHKNIIYGQKYTLNTQNESQQGFFKCISHYTALKTSLSTSVLYDILTLSPHYETFSVQQLIEHRLQRTVKACDLTILPLQFYS